MLCVRCETVYYVMMFSDQHEILLPISSTGKVILTLNISLVPTVVRVRMRRKILTQRQQERRSADRPTMHARGEWKSKHANAAPSDS